MTAIFAILILALILLNVAIYVVVSEMANGRFIHRLY